MALRWVRGRFWRAAVAVIAVALLVAAARAQLGSDPTASSTISGQLFYTDPTDSTNHEIRLAFVEVWRCGVLCVPVFLGSTTTDMDGRFTFTWGQTDQDVWASVFSKASAAEVFCPVDSCPVPEDGKATFHHNLPKVHVIGSHDYGSQVVPSNPAPPYGADKAEAFRIYDSVVRAWLWIRDQVGIVVPRVSVQYPCGPLCPTGVPYFNPYVIRDVYMSNGQTRGTIVHEYGHWVMWSAYDDGSGLISLIWPVPLAEQLACMVHRLETACGIHIGWTEGWADFLQIAVFSDPAAPSALIGDINMEDPPSTVTYVDLGTFPWETGESVEGNVAAALWDLLDSHNDGEDYAGVGPASIFDTLWNGPRHATFREFYDDYRARGYAIWVLNAAAFENTIDYNLGPRILSVTAPTGWASGHLTLTATGADDTGGYVDGFVASARFDHSLDGGANWLPIGSSSTLSFLWNTNPIVSPSVVVRARVLDNLDVASDWIQSTPFALDNSPPTGSVSINGGASRTYVELVTLTLTAEDPESGVSEMRFSNDGVSLSPWEPFATTKAWLLSPSLGPDTLTIKTVFVQFRNTALAVSPGSADSIELVDDRSAPQTTILSIVDGSGYAVIYGGRTPSPSIRFTFAVTDNFEVAGIFCSLDGIAPSPCSSPVDYTGLSVGTHTFELSAFDVPGNKGVTVYTWTVRSPSQASQDLIDEVTSLRDQGKLNGPQATGLMPMLDKALSDLAAGDTARAIQDLQVFIQKVEARIRGKILSAADGQPLMDYACNLIRVLGGTC